MLAPLSQCSFEFFGCVVGMWLVLAEEESEFRQGRKRSRTPVRLLAVKDRDGLVVLWRVMSARIDDRITCKFAAQGLSQKAHQWALS
jgi:hypothetical protein